VWGDLSWDDIPGDFDNDFGWEAGIGLDLIRSRVNLGLDISYRDIEFDYNTPIGQGVNANRRSIDFSGYSFSGSLRFTF
ncbi:hypothetical protein ACFLZG_04680, partial [Thermodesulfobacteriota bacterium]